MLYSLLGSVLSFENYWWWWWGVGAGTPKSFILQKCVLVVQSCVMIKDTPVVSYKFEST